MRRIHKLFAWILGVWLALVCVSGSILLFKQELLSLMYPSLSDIRYYSPEASEQAALLTQLEANQRFRYVIMASKAVPWHVAVDVDNSHHYFDVFGEHIVTRPYLSDWIDWVREFHMNFLLGDMGETLLGILALGSLILLISGTVHWWPKRFNRRLFVIKLQPWNAKNLRQSHTLIGIIMSPLLALAIFTSLSLTFNSVFRTVLIKESQDITSSAVLEDVKISGRSNNRDEFWQRALSDLKTQTQEAALRLVSFSKTHNTPIKLRVKMPDEWHPNGRSIFTVSHYSGTGLHFENAMKAPLGEKFLNALYPLHISAVGGLVFLTTLFIVGFIPSILMCLGLLFGNEMRKKRASR